MIDCAEKPPELRRHQEMIRVALRLWRRETAIGDDRIGAEQVLAVAWADGGDELVYQLTREFRRVGYSWMINAVAMVTDYRTGWEWASDRMDAGYFEVLPSAAGNGGFRREWVTASPWVPSWTSPDSHRWLYQRFPGIKGSKGDPMRRMLQEERLKATNQLRWRNRGADHTRERDFDGLQV